MWNDPYPYYQNFLCDVHFHFILLEVGIMLKVYLLNIHFIMILHRLYFGVWICYNFSMCYDDKSFIPLLPLSFNRFSTIGLLLLAKYYWVLQVHNMYYNVECTGSSSSWYITYADLTTSKQLYYYTLRQKLKIIQDYLIFFPSKSVKSNRSINLWLVLPLFKFVHEIL